MREKEINEELERWHKYSTNNGGFIRNLNFYCGCFYCCKVFQSSEVVEFIKGSWKRGWEDTALCPKCGIDSVVHMFEGMDLQAMHDYWFGEL